MSDSLICFLEDDWNSGWNIRLLVDWPYLRQMQSIVRHTIRVAIECVLYIWQTFNSGQIVQLCWQAVSFRCRQLSGLACCQWPFMHDSQQRQRGSFSIALLDRLSFLCVARKATWDFTPPSSWWNWEIVWGCAWQAKEQVDRLRVSIGYVSQWVTCLNSYPMKHFNSSSGEGDPPQDEVDLSRH